MTDLVPALQQQVTARWEIAAGEVRQALDKSLCIAFFGSASAGKDSAIRALFGIDFGQIDPIPGSTSEVRVSAMDPERKVLIVNAPGFGDVRRTVDDRAREVVEKFDVAVYVLNCDGGATIDERNDLTAIRATGRPVLVCLNKIDLIRPHQRDEFVRTTLAQLGVEPDNAAVVAFDPIPALSDHPIGVERVVAWIHEQLEQNGKSLLFAKNLRNRSAACEPIIRTAAKRAAMAGAIPLPGADATVVTAIQVKMISDIAAIFGQRMDKDLMLFILGEALAGSSKGFVKWALGAAKTAGWVPGGQIINVAVSAIGATIAGATTYGVGRAAIAFMMRQGQVSVDELRHAFDEGAFAYKDDRDDK